MNSIYIIILIKVPLFQYPFGRKDNCCDVHWHACHFEDNPEVYGGKVNKFPGEVFIKIA